MLYCQFCGASLRPDAARSRAPAAPAQGRDAQHGDAYGAADRAGARGGFGATAEVSGRLVTIARDGAEGASYPLSGDQLDIGREDGNILLR